MQVGFFFESVLFCESIIDFVYKIIRVDTVNHSCFFNGFHLRRRTSLSIINNSPILVVFSTVFAIKNFLLYAVLL
jgi:hypothetical protein